MRVEQSRDNVSERSLSDEDGDHHYSRGLFYRMATYPLPFLFVLPVIFAALIGLGWSKDKNEIVENQIANIWISTSGSYARDRAYLKSLGRIESSVSTFAAMALARDSGNLFTASRLEEIRARMEKTERTTVCKDLFLRILLSDYISRPIHAMAYVFITTRSTIKVSHMAGPTFVPILLDLKGIPMNSLVHDYHPWIYFKKPIGS